MIRNLAGKLAAFTAAKPAAQVIERSERNCYAREDTSPLDVFGGFERVDVKSLRRITVNTEFPSVDMRKALFVDTETTGLRGAGTVPFLIGAGYVDEDVFTVRQLVMRDYPEEASQLAIFADMLDDAECVVTFNGLSYDMPLIHDRFIMNGMRGRWRELPHIDLLHASRRVWKMRLESCSLQRVEEKVLGIHRFDDVPGAEIPAIFFEYMRTRDFSLIEPIMAHNLQDVRSMALLVAKLAKVFDNAASQMDERDIYSLARCFKRIGESDNALECYKSASAGLPSASIEIAREHKRARDYHAAIRIYEKMIERREGGLAPYVELAKIYEHNVRDYVAALRYIMAAMARASTVEEIDALEARRARVQAKVLNYNNNKIII